jgi:hypothetical protein
MTGLDDVDISRVQSELEAFVRDAAPRNGSGNGYITTQSYPICGRSQALALAERVHPILDHLYPEWRTDNPPDSAFEFSPEHDGCMRLLERIRSHGEIQAMLGSPEAGPQLDAEQLHPLIWQAASAQWSTGHHHESVLAAAKAVNSLLQTKLQRRDLSEVKLVRDAFTDKDPTIGKPRLRFDAIEDDQTPESMRDGVMNFGADCFMAIRKPVGHLPNDEHDSLSKRRSSDCRRSRSLRAGVRSGRRYGRSLIGPPATGARPAPAFLGGGLGQRLLSLALNDCSVVLRRLSPSMVVRRFR